MARDRLAKGMSGKYRLGETHRFMPVMRDLSWGVDASFPAGPLRLCGRGACRYSRGKLGYLVGIWGAIASIKRGYDNPPADALAPALLPSRSNRHRNFVPGGLKLRAQSYGVNQTPAPGWAVVAHRLA